MKRRHVLAPALVIVLAFTALLFTAGCATVNSGGAQAFSTGVTAARAQTKTAFDGIIELTRANSIEHALNQKSLREEDLVEVPNGAARAAWNSVFDFLEAYARHLAALGSPEAGRGVEDSLGSLATQFKATSAKLGAAPSISPGVATGFTEAASALARARAQKQAKQVAAQTDPAIRGAFIALADAIGADEKSQLRGTVRRGWDGPLGKQQDKFQDTQSPDERRGIVKEYVALLAKRDAQDELLAALRRTYLSLAEAHTALAQGETAGVNGALNFIAAELKHTRELQDRLTQTLSK